MTRGHQIRDRYVTGAPMAAGDLEWLISTALLTEALQESLRRVVEERDALRRELAAALANAGAAIEVRTAPPRQLDDRIAELEVVSTQLAAELISLRGIAAAYAALFPAARAVCAPAPSPALRAAQLRALDAALVGAPPPRRVSA